MFKRKQKQAVSSSETMFEELKAWADKWGVEYEIVEGDGWKEIAFFSMTIYDATLFYNTKNGKFTWYGGD